MDLISCLCVSRPQRYGQLQRAILDFLAQDYERKELVVVVDVQGDYASAVQGFAARTVRAARGRTPPVDVQVIARPVRCQLDGLLYGAVHARGGVLCLWDDDNLNHPERLTRQFAVQADNPEAVTVLTEALYLFHKDAELFVVNADRPSGPAAQRTVPSSLMAYRQWFPVMDPSTRARPSESMVNNTTKAGRQLVTVSGEPYLHLVGVTYDHVRAYDYHRRAAQTQSRPAEWLAKNKDEITAALDRYWFDGPVAVEGVDAGGFQYAPKANAAIPGLYPVKVDPPDPPKAKEPAPKPVDK